MASVEALPRGRGGQRFALLAVYASVPLALAAVVLARRAGLIADTPLWIVAAILVVGSIANYVTSWYRRDGRGGVVSLHLRVAASVLTTSASLYAAGWGALLMVGYAVGSAELLRSGGPETRRPTLAWSVTAVVLGEAAVRAGIAPSMVPADLSHAVALGGLICTAIVTNVLGEAFRSTEAAEAALRARAQHFEALIEHATDLIGVLATDGTIVSLSPAVTTMLGYGRDEVAGRPVTDYIEDVAPAAVVAMLAETAATPGEAATYEMRLRHADGTTRRVVATLASPDEDWGGHIVMNVHDVTLQRDLEDQLRHDARHDPLTGLLNRKAFSEASERACARAARDGREVGMLYIDLDGFKEINDTFGHDAGDRVLVEAAQRIMACLAERETLARLGGDEFAVLIERAAEGRAVALAEEILEAIGGPVAHLSTERRVGASIGIAVRSDAGIEIATLLRDADAAMYAAKRNGRARWEISLPDSRTGTVVEV